jgi:hypothetical protein
VSTVPSIDTPRGKTHVSSRAMTRVVSAVAAETLAVEPSEVSVDLATAQEEGELALTVRVSAGAVATDHDAGDDETPSRTDEAGQRIRSLVGELTGIRIGDVTIDVSKNRLRLPRLGA